MANSPFDNVASEILGVIFSFCPSPAQDFYDSSYETDYKNGAVALRISHVSRRWRAVSHTTPSLWRTITVIEPWVGKYSIDHELLAPHIERVEHYLELSGTLPLRVVLIDLPSLIGSGNMMDKFQFRAIEGLIYPLTAEIHRWESFHARLAPEYFIDALDLNKPMPLLTELALATSLPPGPRFVEDEDEPVPRLTAALFSKETPKLERLEVYGIELQDDMPCFAPSCALRRISVCGIELNKVVPIIGAVSAKMSLKLSGLYPSESTVDPVTCLSHTLSIGTHEQAQLFALLILASSVKALEFHFLPDWPSPFPLVSFKDVLSRSPSSTEITNLTLQSLHMSDTHLLNLLATLSSLTHLTIEEYTKVESGPSKSHKFPPPLSEAFFDVLADSEHDNDRKTFTAEYHSEDQTEKEWRLNHIGDGKPFDVSLCPLLPRLTHLVLVFHH